MSNLVKHWEGHIVRRASAPGTAIDVVPCSSEPRRPINFWIERCLFGRLTVAARDGKVCWVGIHDSVEFLEAELRADFRAELIGAEQPELAEAAQSIAEEIANPARDFVLPVTFAATSFQLAVWRELCAIPRGLTSSYGAIARRLDRPQAARAVGRANGSNALAVIIPCHRAIGADGSLTGYRWGVEYKQRLLAYERRPGGAAFRSPPELSTARAALP